MVRVRRKLRSAEAVRRELQAAKLEASAARQATDEVVRSRGELERGHRQLERLYQVARLLAAYDGDATLALVLAQVAQAVPLRTAVLVDASLAAEETPARLLACGSPGVSLAAREAAAARACQNLALGGPQLLAAASRLQAVGLPAVQLPELPGTSHPRGSGDPGAWATFPLLVDRRPAAGLWQLEGAARLRDGELLFLRSVADQLAVALDRHAARLRDVALRERAEALDRRQKELMAIVSHDLRNPLSAVLLGVSTLRRRPDLGAAVRADHLEVMHRAATRAHRLIHDLLDAGRIEAGHLVLAKEPVEVRSLVEEAVQLMQPLSEEREVACSALAPPDLELPRVLADRERILQVFSNLIGNAIKFARPGGRIAVHASHHGHEVRCAVLDDGPGIEVQDLPHVFDRYWQARACGTAAAGVGLGLAIAKGIVEAHGGRIWVEPGIDGGASFVFTLPAFQELAGQD